MVASPFGIVLFPPFNFSAGSPLAYDLAEAIAARFASLAATTLAGFTGIYESQAGDRARLPYLIFAIPSGTLELITSTSQWDDHRVRFEAFAARQKDANALRDAVVAAYQGQPIPFTSGAATPFVRVDRVQGKERGRTVNDSLVFKAAAIFQTRVRTDL
jgi:hypothetical protein